METTTNGHSAKNGIVPPVKTEETEALILKVYKTGTLFDGKVKYVVADLRVSRLKNWSINPDSRNSLPPKLVTAVEEAGAVLVPAHVFHDGTIIDAHARGRVANYLKIFSVLGIVYYCDEEYRRKLFHMLNTTTRLFSTSQQIEVLANTNGKLEMGQAAAGAYKIGIEGGLGKKDFKKSPSATILRKTKRFCNLVVQYKLNGSLEWEEMYPLVYQYIIANRLSKQFDWFLNQQTENKIESLWKKMKRGTPITSAALISL